MFNFTLNQKITSQDIKDVISAAKSAGITTPQLAQVKRIAKHNWPITYAQNGAFFQLVNQVNIRQIDVETESD
jgi:hypothetical protein